MANFTLTQANALMVMLTKESCSFFDLNNPSVFRESSPKRKDEDAWKNFIRFVKKTILPIAENTKLPPAEKVESINQLVAKTDYATLEFSDFIKQIWDITDFKLPTDVVKFLQQTKVNVTNYLNQPNVKHLLRSIDVSKSEFDKELVGQAKAVGLKNIIQDILIYARDHQATEFVQFLNYQFQLYKKAIIATKDRKEYKLESYGCGFYLARPLIQLCDIDLMVVPPPPEPLPYQQPEPINATGLKQRENLQTEYDAAVLKRSETLQNNICTERYFALLAKWHLDNLSPENLHEIGRGAKARSDEQLLRTHHDKTKGDKSKRKSSGFNKRISFLSRKPNTPEDSTVDNVRVNPIYGMQTTKNAELEHVIKLVEQLHTSDGTSTLRKTTAMTFSSVLGNLDNEQDLAGRSRSTSDADVRYRSPKSSPTKK